MRECARVQTFPDDFRFIGSRRDCAQLVGNAVPPRLAEVIARSLRHDLETDKGAAMPGALLSFTPTLSMGASPILDVVKRKVQKAYGVMAEQGVLWP